MLMGGRKTQPGSVDILHKIEAVVLSGAKDLAFCQPTTRSLSPRGIRMATEPLNPLRTLLPENHGFVPSG
jgi:hypothetical protein